MGRLNEQSSAPSPGRQAIYFGLPTMAVSSPRFSSSGFTDGSRPRNFANSRACPRCCRARGSPPGRSCRSRAVIPPCSANHEYASTRAPPSTRTRSSPPRSRHPRCARSTSCDSGARRSARSTPCFVQRGGLELLESCSSADAGSACHSRSSSALSSGLERLEAFVEGRRLADLRHQVRRHRRAGLVMLCVVREDARLERPVLVELRGELDEVARRVRPRHVRILHLRESPCSPWPNSWNIVVTSSKVSSAG